MKKTNRKIWLAGAILGIIAIALALAPRTATTTSEGAKPVVKIGFSIPMTGDMAYIGEASRNATTLFFENFNAKDAHYRYELVFEDNQTKVANAVSGVHKMIASDKINAVVSLSSSYGLAINPIAENKKVVHFSVSTEPAVAKGDFNFVIVTSPEAHMNLLLDYLGKNTTARSISVVMSNDYAVAETYRRTLADTLATRPEFRITGVHGVTSGERDFSILMRKIEAEKPDVIMNLLYIPEVDIFLRTYRQMGVKIPQVSVELLGHLQNKALAEGAVYTDNMPPTDAFKKMYKERFGTDGVYAEYTYVILEVLIPAFEAYAKQKVVNADVLPFIMKTADGLDTVVGEISSSPTGYFSTPAVMYIIRNGKAETLSVIPAKAGIH